MPALKLPQNLEAEMSVLGVCFLNKYELEKICEEIDADMFLSEANKYIFEAIKELYNNKIALDVTTIKEELDKKKRLNAIGGIEYLSEVIDSVATAANINHYIEMVKEKYTLRSLIDTATGIVTEAYNTGEDINSVLDNAEKNILNVVKARTTTELLPISVVLRTAQENLEKLATGKNPITGLPTGFYELDQATSGLQPGEMIIIAARPGVGKTNLCLNIATNAAFTTDKAVAIFNMEMSSEQLINRMISAIGGIDGKKFQTGGLQNNDWKRYNEAISQLADTNIYIEDNVGITIQEIRAKCRRLANQEKGLGLVVIDYLQLITSSGRKGDSRQQEVSDISRAIKTMAMELKVPVIACAQLARSAERRENNIPMLADLRESGSIEQDADIVMFIHRKDIYGEKGELNKITNVPCDIIISKHRKGTTGKFQLLCELNTCNFRNYLKTNEDDLYNEN